MRSQDDSDKHPSKDKTSSEKTADFEFDWAAHDEPLQVLLDWLVTPGAFPSRNRHFEQYKDPHFRELTRRCRRLKGLVDELRASHPSPVACIQAQEAKGQWWFSFSFSLALGFVKRDARLEKDDVELLLRALKGTPMHEPFSKAWEKATEASS